MRGRERAATATATRSVLPIEIPIGQMCSRSVDEECAGSRADEAQHIYDDQSVVCHRPSTPWRVPAPHPCRGTNITQLWVLWIIPVCAPFRRRCPRR